MMNNTKIIVGHIIHVLNTFSQSSAQSFYYYIVSRVHQEELCTTIGYLQTIGQELLAVDFFLCKSHETRVQIEFLRLAS